MKYDIILAGIRGQGIRTAATVLTSAAAHAGLTVLRSDVVAMSQRTDGAHVRIRFADQPIESDVIGLGQADLILALEPLEALRYLELLSPAGAVVSSSAPVPNIAVYPDVPELLWSIMTLPAGFLVDTGRLARDAGSERVSNLVMVGAVADFLPMEPAEVHAAIDEVFVEKGEYIADCNHTAYDIGRSALRHREVVDEFDTLAGVRH